ncbi:MAG: Rab family GTPase [Bacteroidia bacterium]|nr:Rab family GTPase [Bacteroidia bacterium]
MDPSQIISKKITLLGSFGVGKTSLISRFVEGVFPEKYLTTIGLKVDKRTVVLEDAQLDLIIWDIAGNEEMTRVPQYYLNGCHGVIFVTDLSRPSTWNQLDQQLALLGSLVPGAVVVTAANKTDLLTESERKAALRAYPRQPDFLTSAKTGDQVAAVFEHLARQLLDRHAAQNA